MKLGSNDIEKIYFGSNEVSKIYFGTTLIYQAYDYIQNGTDLIINAAPYSFDNGTLEVI